MLARYRSLLCCLYIVFVPCFIRRLSLPDDVYCLRVCSVAVPYLATVNDRYLILFFIVEYISQQEYAFKIYSSKESIKEDPYLNSETAQV